MAGFEVSEPWKLPCPDESTATKSSMILNTRKIPEVQWLAYKEEIQFLYLTKNNSKEEVMAAMEKTHGFQARCVDPPSPQYFVGSALLINAIAKPNTHGNSMNGASRNTPPMQNGNSSPENYRSGS
jgi:hypothetical protein